MTLNFTLPEATQVSKVAAKQGHRENDFLDIMKKKKNSIGISTDLANLLCGGETSDNFWTQTSTDIFGITPFEKSGPLLAGSDKLCMGETLNRSWGVRPVLPPSETSKITPSKTSMISGTCVAEYGEYPQTLADDDTSRNLEWLFEADALSSTGKSYTFDSWGVPNSPGAKDRVNLFVPESFTEYEYNGEKYIRIVPRSKNCRFIYLSNGSKLLPEKARWVHVEPIEWLVDKSGTWISKKCLFSGIQFDQDKFNPEEHKDCDHRTFLRIAYFANNYYSYEFDKTFMKHYLDTYFSKEVEPSKIKERTREQEKEIRDKQEKILKLARARQHKKDLLKIVQKKEKDKVKRDSLAEDLKAARREKTTFIGRLLGTSGPKKAVKLAKKFHKKNLDQRTALRFGRTGRK